MDSLKHLAPRTRFRYSIWLAIAMALLAAASGGVGYFLAMLGAPSWVLAPSGAVAAPSLWISIRAFRFYIEVSDEGLRVRNVFRTAIIRWSDIKLLELSDRRSGRGPTRTLTIQDVKRATLLKVGSDIAGFDDLVALLWERTPPGTTFTRQDSSGGWHKEEAT